MKFINIVLFFIITCIFTHTNIVFAKRQQIDNYDINYYEDEGQLLFKNRGFMFKPSYTKKLTRYY